jgi:hypothetical protein
MPRVAIARFARVAALVASAIPVQRHAESGVHLRGCALRHDATPARVLLHDLQTSVFEIVDNPVDFFPGGAMPLEELINVLGKGWCRVGGQWSMTSSDAVLGFDGFP